MIARPALSIGEREPENFDEPWQARAFAIVNLLVDQGLLSASDWSTCLGSKRQVDDEVDQGYWQDWLDTAEGILSLRGVLTEGHIEHAVHAIAEAREHRHAAAPEPVFVDPARRGPTA